MSPKCAPCVKWPNHFYNGEWRYGLVGNDFFHKQAIASIDEWGGQQYPSPVFTEGSRGCGGDVCVTATALDPRLCGIALTSDNSANEITSGTVYLNTHRGYTDGPKRDGSCDVRWTYRHEIGHVFSEGHSAIASDLMNAGNNKQEHVDADAQAELRAVYGNFSSGSGCTRCPDIAAIKQKLLEEAAALSSIVTLDEGIPAAI